MTSLKETDVSHKDEKIFFLLNNLNKINKKKYIGQHETGVARFTRNMSRQLESFDSNLLMNDMKYNKPKVSKDLGID